MFDLDDIIFVTFGSSKGLIGQIKKIDGDEYIVYNEEGIMGRFLAEDIKLYDFDTYVEEILDGKVRI